VEAYWSGLKHTHTMRLISVWLTQAKINNRLASLCHGCRFVSVLCSSWRRWSTTRLQEQHRPTCPTSVTFHHLLEYALCAQLTPGHVYFVAHTRVTVFAVLPLPVLVCGTVCRCIFENRRFHSTVLKLC